MRLLQNSPIQDRPAHISPRMVPAYYKHPDLMRIELASKTFPIWPWLAEKFVVALRYLAGYVPEFGVLDKKHDVDGDAKSKDNLHISIIALLLICEVFYKTGGIDSYLLPKLWACSIVILAHALTNPIKHGDLHITLIFYVFWVSVSAIFSHIPSFAIFGQSNVHSSSLMTIVLTAMAFQVGHGADSKQVSKWFILGGLVCAIVCMLQQFDLMIPFGSVNGDDGFFSGRSYGTLGSPIFSSAIMATSVVLAYYNRMFLSIAILAAGIFTTGSRAAIVASVVGIAFCNMQYLKYLVVVGAISICLCYRATDHKKSDLLRVEMVKASISEFRRNMMIGAGPEQFSYIFEKYKARNGLVPGVSKRAGNAHSHNSITESLHSTGIIGSMALLLVIMSIYCSLILKHDRMMIAAMSSAIAYSMFQPMMLSFKIPMAVLIGSAIKAPFTLDGSYRKIYIAIAAAIAISTSVMYFASRMTFCSILFGENGYAASLVGISPQILENYIRPDGTDR